MLLLLLLLLLLQLQPSFEAGPLGHECRLLHRLFVLIPE